MRRLQAMKTTVEWSWWLFLAATFGVPVVFTFVSVLACATRTGRPALYAGHALMSILPFYTLLGGSVELPLTIMLQDACHQVPGCTVEGPPSATIRCASCGTLLLGLAPFVIPSAAARYGRCPF